jgi:hypothetical protein
MGSLRSLRRRGAVALAFAAMALAGAGAVPGADTSVAQAAPGDHFTCRASAVRVTGLGGGGGAAVEPAVANDAGDPCADGTTSLAAAPATLASVLTTGAEQATTSGTPTSASAKASVASASILAAVLGGLQTSGLSASAAFQCVNGQPAAQGSSQVTALTALGQPPVTTDQPQTLHFAGLADVTLNDSVVTPTSITRRAATVTLLPILFSGVQIVLGEATAGVVGNPCPPVPAGDGGGSGGGTTTPPVDATLHAPVLDDGPPSSTPLADATLLYHAVDANATLGCRLDGGSWVPCSGRSAYAHLALGQHCFEARAERGGAVGPSLRYCWTVTPLPPGCTASYHHGYFITAQGAKLGRHVVHFHATTNGRAGRIALATWSGAGVLRRVAYRLDGRTLSRRAQLTLRYAQLDRTRRHRLEVRVAGAGRHARIVRRFHYVSYVSLTCEGRRVVGAIAPRTVVVGGARVRVSARVPRVIAGTAKLRFYVSIRRRSALRAARFSLGRLELPQHSRSAALSARQLKADGTQVLRIEFVPPRGGTVTLRVRFRTRRT